MDCRMGQVAQAEAPSMVVPLRRSDGARPSVAMPTRCSLPALIDVWTFTS